MKDLQKVLSHSLPDFRFIAYLSHVYEPYLQKIRTDLWISFSNLL